ncbi:MAG: hypothetical protein Q8L98_07325 [Chlamydiales bacterium]|nr:hypothetical protein [Chlamydiales bacterium]
MSLKIEHTEFAKAKAETVWKFWSDVSTWSLWDLGLEWCKLKEGHTFQLHGEALLLPTGAPQPVHIRITECTPNRSFTDEAKMELGSILVSHEVIVFKDGVQITHCFHYTPSSPQAEIMFRQQILPRLEVKWPQTVRTLARLVEKEG